MSLLTVEVKVILQGFQSGAFNSFVVSLRYPDVSVAI